MLFCYPGADKFTRQAVFDAVQFRTIQAALSAIVFPGIEINVDNGHVLVIGDAEELQDFESKANQVSQKIRKQGDNISVEQLSKIFGNLDDYLVIPHYDKGPSVGSDTLEKLRAYVCAGEVDSAKKFVRVMKDPRKLTPVLFSDGRMQVDLDRLPTRQTFIDCGNLPVWTQDRPR